MSAVGGGFAASRFFGGGAGSAGRGNGPARANGFAARAFVGIGYLCGAGGSAISEDEWFCGVRRWIRRRRRRPFSGEVDLALAEAAVDAGRFWEERDSKQWEAADFVRGIICCWPFLGVEMAAGRFWCI